MHAYNCVLVPPAAGVLLACSAPEGTRGRPCSARMQSRHRSVSAAPHSPHGQRARHVHNTNTTPRGDQPRAPPGLQTESQVKIKMSTIGVAFRKDGTWPDRRDQFGQQRRGRICRVSVRTCRQLRDGAYRLLACGALEDARGRQCMRRRNAGARWRTLPALAARPGARHVTSTHTTISKPHGGQPRHAAWRHAGRRSQPRMSQDAASPPACLAASAPPCVHR